jgi:hypothetical protein
VYCWDLRYAAGGPVQGYRGDLGMVFSLAVDRDHGTLLGGGAGMTCWDLETGA